MPSPKNDFLAQASSDESDNESGYDSEAAEISKTTKRAGNERAPKRRKLSHSSESEDDSDLQEEIENGFKGGVRLEEQQDASDLDEGTNDDQDAGAHDAVASRKTKSQPRSKAPAALPSIHNGPDEDGTVPASRKPRRKKDKTPSRPGVIYLSSLPPYLRPSALSNLLAQRGFGPITRLFLTPASKPGSTAGGAAKAKKGNARQLYSEGWLEFASHKTAKKCAQTLNATPVGGRKGGYYRDDLWNMRYLRGMQWAELMAGVRGERREEEARRDEERRLLANEQRGFLESVEAGRKWEGMRKKRKAVEGEAEVGLADEEERQPRRTWRQFEVKKGKADAKDGGSEDAGGMFANIF